MDDQQSSNAETGNHFDRLGPTASGSEEVTHGERNSATSGNETGASKNHSEPSVLRRRATIARRLATGTAIAAIAGLVVNFFTLLAIRGQLDEMRSSSLQVERAIQQSTRLADAAALSADMAKQSYSAQQRGWMSVFVRPSSPPQPNTDFTVSVSFLDIAQGPALQVSAIEDIRIVDGPTFDTNDFRVKEIPEQGLAVFQTQGISNTVKLDAARLDQKTFDELKAGRKAIVILGKVKYKDAAQVSHSSGACFFVNMSDNSYPYCIGGNWVD